MKVLKTSRKVVYLTVNNNSDINVTMQLGQKGAAYFYRPAQEGEVIQNFEEIALKDDDDSQRAQNNSPTRASRSAAA